MSGQKYWIAWFVMSCVSGQLSPDKNLIWSVNNQSLGTPGLVYLSGDPTDPSTFSSPRVLSVSRRRTLISSVTSDFHSGALYYTEYYSNSIMKMDVNSSKSTPVHRGFGNPLQITVDWATKNLYWIDLVFGWIAVKSLNKDDLFDFKVLVVSEVELPRGIAVDPTRKFLFWTQVGRTPMIKRAYLDGESPQVIAVGGIYLPRALTIDIQTGRIYWVDNHKKAVEYCDYDGGSRRLLRRVNQANFNTLAYYQGLLFVTEGTVNQIWAFQEGTGKHLPPIRFGLGKPMGITVYAEANQPKLPDSCESRGCEHFCVTGSSSAARCLCQEGFVLGQDGRSCSGSVVYSPKLLSFANRTHLCFVDITATTPGGGKRPYCPVIDGVNITAIAADAGRRVVYYADRGRQQISGLSLVDGMSRAILTDAVGVEGLAFDWIRRTLFWTDSVNKQIKSYDTGPSHRTATVLSTNDTLGPLALDPFTRQLFWITKSPLAIKSLSYNDTQREITLVSANLQNPSGIHCDPTKQMLYWTERWEIQSMRIDGTDRKSRVRTADENNQGLTVYKQMVFWSSVKPPAYLNRDDLGSTVFAQRRPMVDSGEIVDVIVLDSLGQQTARGVCFNNGGCQHYCIPTGGATRKCQCELGFELQTDGRTCVTEFLTTDYFLVTDFLAQRFYQVELETGRVWGSFRSNAYSTAVATNVDNTRVYWSDFLRHEIKSSSPNGSDPRTLTSTGKEYARRLSVDPVTGNIFYTAKKQNSARKDSYVAVVSANGQSRKTLIRGLNSPRAIALYPSEGIMFWSDITLRHIGRSNMDGSQRQTIINNNIIQPNAIAIDFEENRLFWGDGRRNGIERCTLFGADRQTILKDDLAHIMQIVIHGDKLYYTGWNRFGITVANKADGGNRRYLMEYPMFVELSDFQLVRPGAREQVTNQCTVNNGGCSSLCLPTPTGSACACADGVLLESDGRTCVGDYVRTSTTTSVPVSSRCDFEDNDSCFIFRSEKLTFSKAERSCQKMDGHLASIDSSNIQKKVSRLVRDKRIKDVFWIGLYRKKKDWFYTDQKPFSKTKSFANWDRNEPNNQHLGARHKEAKCVVVNPGKSASCKWRDRSCGAQYSYICQVPLLDFNEETNLTAVIKPRSEYSESTGAESDEGGHTLAMAAGIAAGSTLVLAAVIFLLALVVASFRCRQKDKDATYLHPYFVDETSARRQGEANGHVTTAEDRDGNQTGETVLNGYSHVTRVVTNGGVHVTTDELDDEYARTREVDDDGYYTTEQLHDDVFM